MTLPTSFGIVGKPVDLQKIPDGGLLQLPFDSKGLGWIPRHTLRLFLQDPATGRLRKVPGSRPAEDRAVVLGTISEPGTYVIIGLHSHPLVRETIELICSLRPALGALPASASAKFQEGLCQLILCSPDFGALNPKDWLAQTAKEAGIILADPLPNGGINPGPGDSVCQLCTGGDVLQLPECEIVHEPHLDDPVSPVGQTCCCLSPWESLGPNHISGAIRQIEIDPSDVRTLYAISASGGVFRLNDVTQYPAVSWRPLSDSLERLRFRRLAVAPSDRSIVYSANSRKELLTNPILVTSDIFQSTNGGESWHSIQARGTGVVHRLAVDPSDATRVWAATSTGLWRWTGAPGVWSQIKAGDFLDFAIDPSDSGVLYLGERNIGLHKSINGGGIWSNILAFSAAAAGNRQIILIALGLRNKDESLQTAAKRTVGVRFGNEVCLSHNAGATWDRHGANNAGDDLFGGAIGRSDTNPTHGHEWCNAFAVDPFNPSHLLVGGRGILESLNGGVNWSSITRPHEDIQDFTFDPQTQGLVYHASDGGLFFSRNGGTRWPTMSREDIFEVLPEGQNLALDLVTSEFRHIVVLNGRCLGAIDHTGLIYTENLGGRWQFLFASPERSDAHGNESDMLFPCPASPDRFYMFNLRDASSNLTQIDLTHAGEFVTATITVLAPQKGFTAIPEAASLDTYKLDGGALIGGFPGPFAARFFSEQNQRLLVFAASKDTGGNFRVFSLTLPQSGTVLSSGPTSDLSNSARGYSAIAFSETERGLALVMETTGALWTRNYQVAGSSFSKIGSWLLPPGNFFVSHLVPAPAAWASGIVYALTQRAIGRSTDGGVTWRTICEWNRDDEALLAIALNPSVPGQVFLGTNRGVHLSQDRGVTWNPWGLKMPNAPVTRLLFDQGFLYAATYGRGLWRLKPCA